MNEQAIQQGVRRAPHDASHQSGSFPWVLLAIAWVLILCTVNLSDRLNSAVSLDFTAQLKVGTRLVSFGILAVMLLWQSTSARAMAVSKCLLPLGLFVAWGALSILWSPLRNVSTGQIGSFAVLVLLAANVALFWKSAASTSLVFLHLSLALLVLSVSMTLAHFLDANTNLGARDQEAVVHSTLAAATASLGLILLLGARMVWGWTWSRVLVVPGVAIHAIQLYLAHSRAAIAATLFVCCLLYLVFVNRHAIWAGLLFFCLAAVSCLLLDLGLDFVDSAVSSGTQFAQRDDYDSISNLSGRTEMWEAVWNSYLESPWIGHGYFISSAQGELEVWYVIGNWTAHNAMLQVLVSTGVIGALLFVWGLWRPVGRMFSALSSGNSNHLLIRFVFVLACWFLIWSLFNESITGPLQPECVVFFVILGLGIGSAITAVRPQTSHESVEPLLNQPAT
jgi:O-antigen ligase